MNKLARNNLLLAIEAKTEDQLIRSLKIILDSLTKNIKEMKVGQPRSDYRYIMKKDVNYNEVVKWLNQTAT